MAINKDFIQFMKDLSQNNNRDWFHSNKKRYEAVVKKPFYELVGNIIEKMDLDLEVKNAVFRINRDIRFSKDKSPYKTHVGAVISKGGRKNPMYPGVYLQLSHEGTYIGGGCHSPDKESLTKIRSAIVQDPKRIEKLQKNKKFVQYFPEGIAGDKNKILPKEFKEKGKEIPILFHKQFYYMAHYADDTTVLRPDLADFTIEHYKAAKGWVDFLTETLF